ncbi:elongation factor G [Myxococcota bacterium]|nr:elongation factor G [Myxococcota bacterium]MBU1380614.1 elongation factor G [Myxococcota bacterium]MBU1496957.1 elongation factor G [Myxococcota bacterium]
MSKYESNKIRNLVIVGQRGVGKTSFAEAMLFVTKANTRLGSVDDETSTFDFEPEEQKRHSTVSTSYAWSEWNNHKINVIDTPGASDFMNDSRISVAVSDGAFVLVGATDGVQVGTEKVWEFVNDAGIARSVVITGMDKERSNFNQVVKDVQETLSRNCVPIHIPIGNEASFKGMVNVITGKALIFENGVMTETSVPSDLVDEMEAAREALMEIIAESDEELTDKYLEEGTLSEDDMARGFPKAVRSGILTPIMCASSKRIVGIDEVLNFAIEFFPSPVDRIPFRAVKGEDTIEIKHDNSVFTGAVFKTFSTDIGTMSIFRIISGSIGSDGGFTNVTQDRKERFSQLYVLRGKKRDNCEGMNAGDIGAVAKLKLTLTGDTIADDSFSHVFDLGKTPEPIAIVAVHPKSKADEDKLGSKLNDIVTEDPALKLWRDIDSSELLLGGMGQMHLDVAIEKLKRGKVEVETTLPRIPYRETITKKSPVTEGKHKKQSGGRGQFGVCFIELEPLPADTAEPFIFEDKIFGGAIPKQWIPSVEKGIRDRMSRGVIAGYPVINVKVALLDGKYHDVDSSDAAFQMAGSKGFQAAVKNANPVLLEPIYNLEVTVPQEYMGTIMGSITSKRGRPLGSDQKGKNVVVKAQVPLAEIQKYSADLESMTSGRGTFNISMDHYERVPPEIATKIISSAKMEEEEE